MSWSFLKATSDVAILIMFYWCFLFILKYLFFPRALAVAFFLSCANNSIEKYAVDVSVAIGGLNTLICIFSTLQIFYYDRNRLLIAKNQRFLFFKRRLQ